MTYGIYTKDLTGSSLQGVSLEDAKKYCYGDRMVCSEKDIAFGFAVRIAFTKSWRFRWKPFWNEVEIGFMHISWEWLKYKWADKIVWTKEGNNE